VVLYRRTYEDTRFVRCNKRVIYLEHLSDILDDKDEPMVEAMSCFHIERIVGTIILKSYANSTQRIVVPHQKRWQLEVEDRELIFEETVVGRWMDMQKEGQDISERMGTETRQWSNERWDKVQGKWTRVIRDCMGRWILDIWRHRPPIEINRAPPKTIPLKRQLDERALSPRRSKRLQIART
jgi:hypothetical protein